MPGADSALTSGRHEYDVKAAVLYRCLELVQWPAHSNSTSAPPAPITIGLLGKNPFGKSLDSFARKTLSGRPLVVTSLASLSQAAECNLVFVSSSERKHAGKILTKIAGLPILTIGESPGFIEAGGVINFVLDGNNIRLDVNSAAAQKVGLVLDPHLLKLAPPTSSP